MFIDGAWVDVTSRVRAAAGIVISGRGRANEQGRSSPCTCDFELNNADGLFSNRNPSSAYYGLLPRNLPVRFSVTEDRSFAILDSADGTYVRTTDKAVLDITTEIDIRIEYELDHHPDGLTGYILASKYASGGNASWVFLINKSGYLQLIRSSDGTNLVINSSTVPVDPMHGPIAARVTYDSDNGSGNRETKYYTSDTISGSWTQLGATVTSAGTATIFASTAELELGRINGGDSGGLSELVGLVGRIYAFELYSGIASPTLVAEADIYNQARGTTSFSDGLGTPNTWTVEGTAEITPDDRRFTGEISALPIVSDVSGNDVYVPVQAADITRRRGKGATAVKSPLADYFSSLASTSYLTLEDGTAATTLTNVTSGAPRGTFVDLSFSQPSDLPATAGAATINSTSSRLVMRVKPTSDTDFACFNWAMKMASVPAASVTIFDLALTGGSLSRLNFSVTATTYVIAIYDNDGALLTSASSAWTTSTVPTNWNLFRVQFTQNGADLEIDLGWYHPGEGVLTGISSPAIAVTENAGRIWQVTCAGSTNNLNTQLAHLFVGQFFLDNTDYAYVLAANAFVGETTAQRAARVGAANGITVTIVGSTVGCEVMGAQAITAPLEILYDCATTEGGQLYPDRNSLALIFRTRRSLLNQFGPEVSFTGGDLGPAVPLPTDDDGQLRNAVTATRTVDGSTGYAEQDTGPNSTTSATASPPGVGVVPASISVNPQLSERLNDLAAWDVHLGTWDEPRWPQVSVALERATYAGSAADVRTAHNLSRLDVGDMLAITDMPSWLPPDDALVMAQGLREVLGNYSWRISWNTSPYGPYITNDLTSGAASRYRVAAGSAGYVLAGSLTSSATSFTVTIPAGSALWGTTAGKPGNFPQNVVVGGEVMTISGISGTSSPQTFTVSARSVNGIVKAHSAGDAVEVQYPFYVAL